MREKASYELFLSGRLLRKPSAVAPSKPVFEASAKKPACFLRFRIMLFERLKQIRSFGQTVKDRARLLLAFTPQFML